MTGGLVWDEDQWYICGNPVLEAGGTMTELKSTGIMPAARALGVRCSAHASSGEVIGDRGMTRGVG